MITRLRTWLIVRATTQRIRRDVARDAGVRPYVSDKLHDRWTCRQCGSENLITSERCVSPLHGASSRRVRRFPL